MIRRFEAGRALRGAWRSSALVSALALVAAWPLLLPGLVNTHHYGDSPFLVLRLIELDRAWADGPRWVRWAPDFAYGYGYPFFNFYAPLAYYLAELLHLAGLGYVAAIETTFLAAFLAAGLGAYALARDAWGERAGLLAAAAYTLAPYHLVNVYARGDALAEFAAFAFYPWILLALRRLGQSGRLEYGALAGLLFAGLVLTHNTSALAFSPVVAGYALWASLVDRAPDVSPFRTLPLAALALALGLVASSLFWLPALAERSDVHLQDMTTGYFDFHNHFLTLGRLIDPGLFYDYRLDGPGPDGLPFRLGLGQTLLALTGLALGTTARSAGRARPRRTLAFFALVALAVLFFLTPASTPVWERVPLLPFLQFPWRLLSVAALALALLAASGLAALATRPRLAGAYLAAGVALALLSGLGGLNPERIALAERDLTPDRVFEYEYATTSLGTTTRFEYLPGTVPERPWTSELALSFPERDAWRTAELRGAGAEDRVETLADRPALKRVRVHAAREAELVFATYWFAGWTARLDGAPVRVRPAADSGRAVVAVPPGEHEVELRFESTPLRQAVELASLAGLLVLVALLVLARPRLAGLRAGALPLVALLLGAALIARPDEPLDPPGLSTLAADIHSPLAHRHPEGIAFEGGWRLRGYAGLPEQLAADSLPRLTLEWEAGPGAEPAEVRASLVAPSHFLGSGDRSWGRASASIAPGAGRQRTELALAGPPGRPPGLYYVHIELFAGGRKLGTLTPNGIAPDRDPLLGPLASRRIVTPPPNTSAALPELAGAELVAPEDGPRRIEAELRWRAPARVAEDLRVSVRLVDERGASWGQQDGRPVDGFYPTTLWAPGEVVRDRHTVVPLPGTPPGRYRVEARVYSLLDLQPRPLPGSRSGVLDLGEVTIARPPEPREAASVPARSYPRQPAELRLLGGELGAGRARPGDAVPVTLFWRAEARPTRDWRLVLAAGAPSGARAQPLSPSYPPVLWVPGAPVRVQTALAVPADAAGDLPVRVYLQDPATGTLDPPEGVDLGAIRVEPPERRYDLPTGLAGPSVAFGGLVRFLGFEQAAEPAAPGGKVVLTLYWQALAPIERSYTVFTHLLDGANRVVGQRDSVPVAGTRPTTGWLPGEVIADRYEIPVGAETPPGEYALEIGLYDASTGARLKIADGANAGADHLVLGRVEVAAR